MRKFTEQIKHICAASEIMNSKEYKSSILMKLHPLVSQYINSCITRRLKIMIISITCNILLQPSHFDLLYTYITNFERTQKYSVQFGNVKTISFSINIIWVRNNVVSKLYLP